MTSKRRALKTLRKSGPIPSVPANIPSKKSTKKQRINPKACSLDTKDRPSFRCNKLSPGAKNLPTEETSTNKSESSTEHLKVQNDNTVTEIKRKRLDTSEYIRKRFLYDAEDPPKRTRIKKRPPDRSSQIPLVVSTKSRSRALTLDGKFHLRSKRGRQLKPNLDYSPPHSDDSVSSPERSTNYRVSSHMSKRRAKKHSSHGTVQELTVDRRSTWDLPSLFDEEASSPMENDRFSASESVDLPHFLPNKYSGLDTYSNVLLNELRHPIEERNSASLHEPPQRTASMKQRSMRRQRIFRSGQPQKRVDTYGSPLLSPGPVSSGEDDIIHFCSDSSADRFMHSRPLDGLDAAEDDYLRSDTRGLSEKQLPIPNDDIEEEDLLAPELSIFTGSTTLTSPDGVILPGVSDIDAAPITVLITSGSRRKSPVRPMQVLRTKSSIIRSTSTSTNLSATVLGTSSDNSSLVYAQPAGYLRRLPDCDSSHKEDLYQQSFTERPSVSESGQSSIPVRMTSPNSSTCPPNSIRTIRDPVGKSSGDSSAILHSESTVSSTRAFVNPSSGRTNPPGSSKPSPSVSHSNLATGNRRRPSILKRGLSSFMSSNPVSVSEESTELCAAPAGRAVVAFSQGMAHSQRANAVVKSVVSGPHAMASCSSSVSAASCTTPAKLFQLVTSAAVDSPHTTSNLTASDKLFGRRSKVPAKGELLTSVSAPPFPCTTTVDSTGLPSATTQSPYRYALLRGSVERKRYLVLGNHGIFDRSTIAPLAPSTNTDDQFVHRSTLVNELNESSQDAPAASLVHIDADLCNSFDAPINSVFTRISPSLGLVPSATTPNATSAIAT